MGSACCSLSVCEPEHKASGNGSTQPLNASRLTPMDARENGPDRHSTPHGASVSQLMGTQHRSSSSQQNFASLSLLMSATPNNVAPREAEPPSEDWGRRLNTPRESDARSACDSGEFELSADVGMDGICAFYQGPR